MTLTNDIYGTFFYHILNSFKQIMSEVAYDNCNRLELFISFYALGVIFKEDASSPIIKIYGMVIAIAYSRLV